jgi:hypothetical protein
VRQSELTPHTHYGVPARDSLRPLPGASMRSVRPTTLDLVVLVTRLEGNEEGWRAFLTTASCPLYYYDTTSNEENEDGADPTNEAELETFHGGATSEARGYVHETRQQARKRVQTWVSATQATSSSTQPRPLPVPGGGWRLRCDRLTPWRPNVGEDDSVAVTQAETVEAPEARKRCYAYREEDNLTQCSEGDSVDQRSEGDSVDVTQDETTEAPEVRGGCNTAYVRVHSVTRSGLRYPGEEIPTCLEVPEVRGVCNAACVKTHSYIPVFSPIPDFDDGGQASYCTFWSCGRIPAPKEHVRHFLEEGEITDQRYEAIILIFRLRASILPIASFHTTCFLFA